MPSLRDEVGSHCCPAARVKLRGLPHPLDHSRTVGMSERNALCPCGSGERFKHCCGRVTKAEDPYATVSDSAIIAAVHDADDEGLAKGQEPRGRAFENVLG